LLNNQNQAVSHKKQKPGRDVKQYVA